MAKLSTRTKLLLLLERRYGPGMDQGRIAKISNVHADVTENHISFRSHPMPLHLKVKVKSTLRFSMVQYR